MPAANQRPAQPRPGAPHAPGCRVEVTNDTDHAVDERRLAAAVQMILSDAGCETATVGVAIVDDATIHRLNRQFLEHDYPTDVLSFVLEPPPRLEGEIIASVETAALAAAEILWNTGDELLLYVVHGTLHLVGLLDKDPADAQAMRTAERDVLQRLGVDVAPRDPRFGGRRSASPPTQEPTS